MPDLCEKVGPAVVFNKLCLTDQLQRHFSLLQRSQAAALEGFPFLG